MYVMPWSLLENNAHQAPEVQLLHVAEAVEGGEGVVGQLLDVVGVCVSGDVVRLVCERWVDRRLVSRKSVHMHERTSAQ